MRFAYFSKCFFKPFFAGKGEEEGELSLPSRGVRGLLFVPSEAVFGWLVGESDAQE
jgi:hypothetical protein